MQKCRDFCNTNIAVSIALKRFNNNINWSGGARQPAHGMRISCARAGAAWGGSVSVCAYRSEGAPKASKRDKFLRTPLQSVKRTDPTVSQNVSVQQKGSKTTGQTIGSEEIP